jgi:hypothetical protein
MYPVLPKRRYSMVVSPEVTDHTIKSHREGAKNAKKL